MAADTFAAMKMIYANKLLSRHLFVIGFKLKCLKKDKVEMSRGPQLS